MGNTDISNFFNIGNPTTVRCYDFINPEKTLQEQIDILREDMGWIEYNNGEYLIDYGWKPEFDIEGKFVVYLIKDNNWNNPLNDMRTGDIAMFFSNIQFCIDFISAKISSS